MWLLLVACWNTETRISTQQEQIAAVMDDHWTRAAAARDAVVAGDLPEAKKAANAIAADLPMEGLPEGARQDELAAAVTALAAAEDVDAAGLAVGRMSAACGSCHQALDATVAEDVTPPPPADEGLEAAMERHAWAARRMWSGLVHPSDEAVAQALQVLRQAPLVPSGTPADATIPPIAAELEVRVQDLAASAARAEDATTRGRYYGEMLGTCSTCHSAFRD